MFNITYKIVFVELKVIIHREFSKSGILKKMCLISLCKICLRRSMINMPFNVTIKMFIII